MHHPINCPMYIHNIGYGDGSREVVVTDSSTPTSSGSPSKGYSYYISSTPVPSGYDIQNAIYSLQSQISQLQSRCCLLENRLQEATREPVPLDRLQVEEVIDHAHELQKQASFGPKGQQLSVWDGLEAQIVKATEKAHGITK